MRKYDILVVLVILLLVSACTTQEVKEPTVIPATETQTPWPSTTVTSTPEPTEVFTPTATFTPTPLPYEGSYDVYPEAKLVIGNEGNIVFGNYSPQGKYFAAALDCGEVHLFELPDYKVTSKFKLSEDILDVLISSDETILAVGYENEIIVFDIATEEQIAKYILQKENEDDNNTIFGFQISPNDKILAIAQRKGLIDFWNFETNESEFQIEGERRQGVSHFIGYHIARNFAYSNSGSYFVYSTKNKTHIIDAKTYEPISDISLFSTRTLFSPDDFFLFTVNKKYVYAWDTEDFQNLAKMSHPQEIQDIAITNNDLLIAAAGRQYAYVWDTTTWQKAVDDIQSSTLKVAKYAISDIEVSPVDRSLYTGETKFWDIVTGESKNLIDGYFPGFYSAAFSPDGKYLALGSYTDIRLVDLETNHISIIEGRQDEISLISNLVFSNDSKVLISTSGHDTPKEAGMLLWRNIETGEVIRKIEYQSRLRGTALSADGTMIASATQGAVFVWDAHTGERIFVLSGVPVIDHIAFSPDGKYIAASAKPITYDHGRPKPGETSYSFVWDIENDGERVFHKDYNPAEDILSFTADGQTLISEIAREGKLFLRDALSGELVESLDAGRGLVAVANEDISALIGYSLNHNIILWDYSGQEFVYSDNFYNGHTDYAKYARGLAISPDLSTLAVCYDDGVIVLWDISAFQ